MSDKKDMPVYNLEEGDRQFKYRVKETPGGEGIMFCFNCGTCAAACPVLAVDQRFNPRKIIRMVLLGMKEEVFNSDFVWLCSACYACAERCPQDVKITDLMTALQNLAVAEGHIHPAFRQIYKALKDTDRVFDVGEFENQMREKMGLPKQEGKSGDIEKIIKKVARQLVEGE
jgi:heterodisulfide reductase subunit C